MYIFGSFFDFLKKTVNILGFDISLWQVFIFSCLSGAVGTFIGSFFRK